jgi:hypothetical protein
MSALPTTAPVETTKVSNRRVVRYNTFDELLADAERLVQLNGEGKVRPLGNMSLGQALGHLALWMQASIDGIPDDLRPPAPVKLLARLFKGIVLSKGLRPGFKLPTDAASKLIPPAGYSASDGFNALSAACARLRREHRRVPSPLFGPMSEYEWERLHLRHAELHLSFMEVMT